MKKVRKATVIVPRTIEITLFVIESAVPVRPSTLAAPPLWIASLIRSGKWYFVSRKPNRPLPLLMSWT